MTAAIIPAIAGIQKTEDWIPNQVGDDNGMVFGDDSWCSFKDDSWCTFKDDNGCDFEDDRYPQVILSKQPFKLPKDLSIL